ncbi:hypothetical protein BT63DRAFT_286647 [Microthyrium microscopicum]|uniref:Uncharacterized protein n=1 Tax=Microthyrium microscopicum TaxID=703497 RepID=A0A6A6UB59_9PEZI|nr:hypothetical protein BT63DRAFT_286647 [Microthyrium microscopicum]
MGRVLCPRHVAFGWRCCRSLNRYWARAIDFSSAKSSSRQNNISTLYSIPLTITTFSPTVYPDSLRLLTPLSPLLSIQVMLLSALFVIPPFPLACARALFLSKHPSLSRYRGYQRMRTL